MFWGFFFFRKGTFPPTKVYPVVFATGLKENEPPLATDSPKKRSKIFIGSWTGSPTVKKIYDSLVTIWGREFCLSDTGFVLDHPWLGLVSSHPPGTRVPGRGKYPFYFRHYSSLLGF